VITPFLWFNDRAQEAAEFYVSVFKDAAIISQMPGPGDKPMGVTFRLGQQQYIAFNGGSYFKLTEAFSMFVQCESQQEMDELYTRLSEGGSPSQCGWLKDQFGLSWQILPTALGKMLGDPDRQKSGRVMQAMMQMGKLDLAKLQAAYAG
jgi:predicted 3-demethylubiquinone-9 3-methyltransferase (glyoxalase superfamily)